MPKPSERWITARLVGLVRAGNTDAGLGLLAEVMDPADARAVWRALELVRDRVLDAFYDGVGLTLPPAPVVHRTPDGRDVIGPPPGTPPPSSSTIGELADRGESRPGGDVIAARFGREFADAVDAFDRGPLAFLEHCAERDGDPVAPAELVRRLVVSSLLLLRAAPVGCAPLVAFYALRRAIAELEAAEQELAK